MAQETYEARMARYIHEDANHVICMMNEANKVVARCLEAGSWKLPRAVEFHGKWIRRILEILEHPATGPATAKVSPLAEITVDPDIPLQ